MKSESSPTPDSNPGQSGFSQEEQLRIYQSVMDLSACVAYRVRFGEVPGEGVYEFLGGDTKRVLGIDPDKLTGNFFLHHVEKNLAENLLEQDIFANYRSFLQGNIDSYEADILLRTPQGKKKWLHDHSIPLKDSQSGKVIGAIGVLQDITHRKQFEEAMRENEAKFRVLTDQSKSIIMLYQDEKILFINSAVEDILGYSPEELIGKPIWEFTHEEEIPTVRQNAADRMKGVPVAPRYQVRLVTKSGEIRWLNLVIHRIMHQGRPAGVVTGFDVTDDKKLEQVLLQTNEELERRIQRRAEKLLRINKELQREIQDRQKTEKALRSSENRYRALVESQQDLIVRVDPQGRYTFVNDAFCRKFGKSQEELLGQTFMPLVHPADLAHTLEEMKKLNVPPYRMTVSQRAMTAEGWRWLDWEDYAIHDDQGKLIEIQAVGRDITERKKAAEDLNFRLEVETLIGTLSTRFISAETEEVDEVVLFALESIGRFCKADRCHLHFFPDNSAVLNHSYEWCAQGVDKLKGKEPTIRIASLKWFHNQLNSSDTIQIPSVDNLPRGSSAEKKLLGKHKVRSTLLRALSYGQKRVGLLGLETVHEEHHWSDDISSMLRIAGDILINALERKIMDEQRQRLEQMQRDFVANVSHEFKTPLTAIQGYTETLLDGAKNKKEFLEKSLHVIHDHSARLSRLTDDLLLISTMEALGLKMKKIPVQISDILESCVETARFRADAKKQTITISCPENLPEIPGDSNRLREVFQNLLVNAIQYSPTGSEIQLTARITKSDQIQVDVRDEGIGIPENEQKRIFERFYRVDTARSRDVGGTGLGLPIVQHIVEAHRGTIQVTSSPGKGTTFTVFLPI